MSDNDSAGQSAPRARNIMTDGLDIRFAAACAIAREAGVLARKRFLERPRSQRPDIKGHQDFLTATDAEVEELIRSRLASCFRRIPFSARKAAVPSSATSGWWIPSTARRISPAAFPHFAISIAFVRDGRVEIGVVYNVMHDELYTAQRGRGATLNGEPIRVSGIADMQPGDGGSRMVVTIAAGALHRRRRQAERRAAPMSAAPARARSASPMWPTGASTPIASSTSIPGTCWRGSSSSRKPAAGPTTSWPRTACERETPFWLHARACRRGHAGDGNCEGA